MKALDMKEAFCFPALHARLFLTSTRLLEKKFSKSSVGPGIPARYAS